MSTRNIENNAARATGANKYIVFSVNKSDGPFILGSMQKYGINYKVAKGYYQGTREDVFIVNAAQFDLVYKYLWWAISTQESILHLGPVNRARDARPAILEYVKIARPPLFLGWFYAVPQSVALARDVWTKDGEQYYVAALERPPQSASPHTTFPVVPGLDASNDSVRRSNRAAVRGHKQAVDRGALHHSTPAYAIGGPEARAAWVGKRPLLTVKGTFNKAGAARTPSGHEF